MKKGITRNHTHPWGGSTKVTYISFSTKGFSYLGTHTLHDANHSSYDNVLKGPSRFIFHSSLFLSSYIVLQNHIPFTMGALHYANLCFALWFKAYGYVVTVPRELPTSFVHLKYFSLEEMFFPYEYGLPILALMMRSSPNMEKLRLQMCNKFEDMDSVTFIEYSDIWLEHLTEFEVKDYCNLNPELELVKLILVKSPKLKKVSIWLDESVDVNEEVKMLRLLLRSPRASPMVDIIVERLP